MSESDIQRPPDPYLDQFLTRAELAVERRVSVDTIDRMVRRGELPPPQRLSPRRQGWRRRDVYLITLESADALATFPDRGSDREPRR
jgi:predicted DNA-binding transcriptional regulator AlpA